MQSVTQRLSAVVAVTLVSCVDELLVSITAVRRIYRLAVRAPVCSLLVFIFSGARSRSSRMQGVRSSCCSGVHSSARNMRISAASAPRRRVLQKPAPLKCDEEDSLPARDGSSRTAYYRKLAAALVLAQRVFPLAQGPAAGRAGASRRETPATAAHKPFAALPNTPASAPPRLREAAPSAPHPLLRGRRRAKAPGRAATRLNAQRSQSPPRRKDVARATFSKLGDARARGAGRV